MIESAADRALMFDPGAFGTRATLADASTVAGVFTVPAAAILGDPGARTLAPVFTTDAATAPAVGATLTVDGTQWRVADIDSDGAGVARLILERA